MNHNGQIDLCELDILFERWLASKLNSDPNTPPNGTPNGTPNSNPNGGPSC
jgi:hypothetical protein